MCLLEGTEPRDGVGDGAAGQSDMVHQRGQSGRRVMGLEVMMVVMMKRQD